jgi:glycerophosphoryl diester phosphodiesterase
MLANRARVAHTSLRTGSRSVDLVGLKVQKHLSLGQRPIAYPLGKAERDKVERQSRKTKYGEKLLYFVYLLRLHTLSLLGKITHKRPRLVRPLGALRDPGMIGAGNLRCSRGRLVGCLVGWVSQPVQAAFSRRSESLLLERPNLSDSECPLNAGWTGWETHPTQSSLRLGRNWACSPIESGPVAAGRPSGRALRALLVSIAMLASMSLAADTVDLVAHRGASADAPENTVPAFELAWARGADVVEGDFFLTADNQVVCIHDNSTARVAGEKLSVSATPYSRLQTLDVGAWKGPKWRGTRIPTLTEVLATLPADRGRIFIEIKDSVRIVKPLAEQLKNAGVPRSRYAIICFKEAVISACKAAMPEVDAHWLVSGGSYKKMGVDGVIQTLKRIGADGLDVQASQAITPELGQALRKHDLEFHCWTVNDGPLARHMLRMGVDSITTDRPAFLRRQITAKSSGPGILQHLSFDDAKQGSQGIRGRALSNTVLKSGKPLPDSGTVALWYRPTKWYDYQTVFDSTADPDVWELWLNKEAEICFRTTAEDLRIAYRLHPVAAVQHWQHVAVTWDDTLVHLYLNGAPVITAKRKQPRPPSGEFCLGGGNAGNKQARGSWDEVVVLDAVLSPAEVRTLMLDGVHRLQDSTTGEAN